MSQAQPDHDEQFSLAVERIKRSRRPRKERPEPTRVLRILNLGAGVQSTALYLMSLRQDEPEHVPVFDYAVFADTQEEPRAVYEHLEWLKSLGGPPIIEATAGKIGDDLLHGENSTGQRFASIPAYTMAEGAEREGRVKRQCTSEYKVLVVERVIRRQILEIPHGGRVGQDVSVHQYMGLSYDEPGRIIRVRGRFQGIAWSKPQFPLFDLEMTRSDCVSYLQKAAHDRVVPRSACVFCPFHSNAEWRHQRDTDPESWERSCLVDEGLRRPGVIVNRGLDAKLYIHRSCVPLREAPIDVPENSTDQYAFGFASECEGMCGL